MTNWNFANPPVSEVVIAASLSSPTLFDLYEIASLHSLFQAEFPRAERQPHVIPMMPFSFGTPQSIEFNMNVNDEPRWWFISDDGRNVVQVQPNFIARNWRRIDLLPIPNGAYTSFAELLSSFKDNISKIEMYRKANGGEVPPPKVLGLSYINQISGLDADGGIRKIRDTLPFLQFSDLNPKYGLQTSWLEQIPVAREGAPLAMHVTASFAAGPLLKETGEVENGPVVRLVFDARAECASWAELYDCAEIAHSHMRTRLLELTTEDLRRGWF